MIQHVYDRVRQTPGVAQVIVATADQQIAAVVAGFGGEVWLTRADHPSGTDRVAEVAAAIDADLIVNVQGDEPLIAPETIAAAIAPAQADPLLPLVTTCERLDPVDAANPNIVKVVCNAQHQALYFSRALIPYPRQPAQAQALWRKHTGLYVYRRETLLHLTHLPPAPLELAEGLEQLRALTYGIPIHVVESTHPSIGVDTPADAERVRRYLAHRETTPPHGAGTSSMRPPSADRTSQSSGAP